MKGILGVLSAVLALAVTPAPAIASPLQTIVIENDVTVGPAPDFSASGPFNLTGPLCQSGQSTDLSRVTLPSLPGTQNLLVTKRFTCDDGSGTFDLALVVHLTFDPFTDNFVWAVVGGTGAYRHVGGFGTGTGEPQADGTLLDTYTGRVITN